MTMDNDDLTAFFAVGIHVLLSARMQRESNVRIQWTNETFETAAGTMNE